MECWCDTRCDTLLVGLIDFNDCLTALNSRSIPKIKCNTLIVWRQKHGLRNRITGITQALSQLRFVLKRATLRIIFRLLITLANIFLHLSKNLLFSLCAATWLHMLSVTRCFKCSQRLYNVSYNVARNERCY